MTKTFQISFMMIILLGLMIPRVIYAQDINIKIGFRDSIKSEIVHESKRIIVHLPDSYSKSNRSYPVLYQVKGDTSSMLEMVSTVNRLALNEEMMPEMIIVAIENVSGKDVWPTNDSTAKGVNDFQAFFERELIPYIGKSYRTTADRILYGQSTTAVFMLYTFITKPTLFSSYIASSGAFPFCEEYFKKISLKSFQQADRYNGQKIFITNGLKDPLISQVNSLQQMTDFSSLVKTKLGDRVTYKYLTYENEGHVPFYSLFDGLKFIYQPNR